MDDYRAIAQQYATQFGIPADLFMRQIQAESAWDPTALSPAGAIGLGQLMPTTAQELGVDIMNPQDNLYGAAKYLRQMYDRFGDWRTALAAYNAGPGRVEQYGGIPPFEETQNYVSSILDEQDVRGGQTMPTMPQEQRPSGLLEMMGVQRQGTGGPQGDLPFYQRDRFKDFAGRLAMAANTLSQRPDPTVPQVVLGAQQSRKANRTAEWLAQQPGGAPYAQMIEVGVSPAEVIAQYRKDQAGAAPTAAMQNYQFLLSQGLSPEDAVGRAFSGGVNVNLPGAPTIGTIPPGYQAVQDPDTGAYRMEVIPGGPAAQEAAAAEKRAEAAAAQTGTKEATIASSVDFLVEKIDKGGIFNLPEAGIGGNLLATIGISQDAVDFRNELSVIQANTAFDRLQQMREASKTGGALGAVSERELDLLMSAYGNLAQSTSPERLRENLLTIKRIMTKIENDPIASAMYYDTSGAPIPSAGGFTVTGRTD